MYIYSKAIKTNKMFIDIALDCLRYRFMQDF